MPDLSRITLDVDICHGKPCVRHMRWPVDAVLDLVGSGMTMDEIIADHPESVYAARTLHNMGGAR
jgi:uncharacterized protein (DUF433 family)